MAQKIVPMSVRIVNLHFNATARAFELRAGDIVLMRHRDAVRLHRLCDRIRYAAATQARADYQPALPQRIAYEPRTGDWTLYLDGRRVGHACSYIEGEQVLNRIAAEWDAWTVDVEPPTPEECAEIEAWAARLDAEAEQQAEALEHVRQWPALVQAHDDAVRHALMTEGCTCDRCLPRPAFPMVVLDDGDDLPFGAIREMKAKAVQE